MKRKVIGFLSRKLTGSVFLGIANKVLFRLSIAKSSKHLLLLIIFYRNLPFLRGFLSSFVGSIMSMSPVVTGLARIMTRHCQIFIRACPDWDTEFYLDEFCLAEVNICAKISHPWIRGNSSNQFSHTAKLYILMPVVTLAERLSKVLSRLLVILCSPSMKDRLVQFTASFLRFITVYKPLTRNFSTVA